MKIGGLDCASSVSNSTSMLLSPLLSPVGTVGVGLCVGLVGFVAMAGWFAECRLRFWGPDQYMLPNLELACSGGAGMNRYTWEFTANFLSVRARIVVFVVSTMRL